MCGIIGLLEIGKLTPALRERAISMASTIRHRGPDWSGIYADDSAILAHERLSIVDVEGGSQPLVDSTTKRVLVANGEIYNYTDLRQQLTKEHAWKTKSDCEVLLYLYEEFGPAFLQKVNGIFSFIIHDPAHDDYLIARDHMGVCPLYIGWGADGMVHVASEMKALTKTCERIMEFPPGSYYRGTEKKFVRWYTPEWAEIIPQKTPSPGELRMALVGAVERQLMGDVPYGVLLSGGLDSSLIAAIASIFSREKGQALHSFSIGLKDSPDLSFARKTAAFLHTIPHEVTFTVQEGLDALRSVIYQIETFDVTTIRASTPMYLLARKIRSSGIKMILSGEGADEIFGGYLYFHMAPDAKEFHHETVRKLFMLSKYDCLRANKSMAAWGVELRVPFLDRDFLDVAMGIDPALKLCPGKKMEKSILQESFAGYIPDEVLWRQKEQFSDGVGYGWIDYLKKYAEETISDEMMQEAEKTFPVGTPSTKEAYLYRAIFEELYPHPSAAATVPVGPTIACSTPAAMTWSKEFQRFQDPSGRSVKSIHESTMG